MKELKSREGVWRRIRRTWEALRSVAQTLRFGPQSEVIPLGVACEVKSEEWVVG